jgi:hypothetical protein
MLFSIRRVFHAVGQWFLPLSFIGRCAKPGYLTGRRISEPPTRRAGQDRRAGQAETKGRSRAESRAAGGRFIRG